MISRCRSFRSIFADRAPEKIVICSLVHERNRYELATVQRYGHKNGASRFPMKTDMMPKGHKHTSMKLGAHFHRKCLAAFSSRMFVTASAHRRFI